VLQREDDPAGAPSKLRLRVDDQDKLPLLAEIVVRGGGKLHSLSAAQNSLEELFVDLMAGERSHA
jgi:hypothetical protein